MEQVDPSFSVERLAPNGQGHEIVRCRHFVKDQPSDLEPSEQDLRYNSLETDEKKIPFISSTVSSLDTPTLDQELI